MTPRLRAILALFLVTAFGLAAKLYPGPGRWWVNNWGPASVAYVVFFMLAAFIMVPRRSAATPIAVGVCAATCLLEFLQLWQPPWLQSIRSSLLGGALLGTTFSWWDSWGFREICSSTGDPAGIFNRTRLRPDKQELSVAMHQRTRRRNGSLLIEWECQLPVGRCQ